MIFRRAFLALIAASMFAAGGAVGVVALAFALYALVEPWLGAAGAAATVAATTAGLMACGGLAMVRGGRRRTPPQSAANERPLERAFELIRQKPVLAGAVAIGAGLLAIRNPKYLADVLRSFLDRGPPSKR